MLMATSVSPKSLADGGHREWRYTVRKPRVCTDTVTRHPMYVRRNNELRSCNHCRSIKAITCYECVSVALGIQHGMRMRPIVLPSVDCPALLYQSSLSYKRHDFRGWGSLLNVNMSLDFLYNFCPQHFLVLSRNETEMIKMYIGLHVKYPIFLSDFDET